MPVYANKEFDTFMEIVILHGPRTTRWYEHALRALHGHDFSMYHDYKTIVQPHGCIYKNNELIPEELSII
jgi:hypothetical protein